MDFRIGHGYDVHKLVENRKLILGGVDIPHTKGLLGHSDADVLSHAIADSLLGAVGRRDIGYYFPDTDSRYHGISSLLLLKEVSNMLEEDGYCIGNIDCTLIAQAPKLSPYIEDMKNNIANALKILPKDINIKATTEENLGFTGRKEGIAAHAISLIKKIHF